MLVFSERNKVEKKGRSALSMVSPLVESTESSQEVFFLGPLFRVFYPASYALTSQEERAPSQCQTLCTVWCGM